ncbi:biotin--[acetyl-CoA-carboxylase] ligase [Pseudoroseicyclus tamaricis]|uniref:biotin--[biotin carboxyl-carrier protein] ligase n=1 Tax=Pseudoroseicyclus tamaricis TaxID=2705421 RepID=A0A6B2JYH9_9RHOB|nr:biotin--[acetyl-CoA-carboxylase] ligase [Pseudoroseicyclus tamaricis]NDV01669.1 biotin--[acetyl-CoA-carboxylase] ligase [Pseudoroseicyclus tamaricis]
MLSPPRRPRPLSTEAPARAAERRVYRSLTSTMDEAARLVREGERGPLWLLALEQTSARGRQGRPWAMPPGNFAATLIDAPEGGPMEKAQRSFVASLALRDALAEVAPQAHLSLKWPNDVLLSEGKVAGILLENFGPALAIGIGVNLAAAPGQGDLPEGAVRPVSLLQETGVAVSPEAFLDRLAPAYARWDARLVAEGFPSIRDAWLAAAARLGQEIRARTPKGETRGRFDGIDARGSLMLTTPAGPVTLPAADVYF